MLSVTNLHKKYGSYHSVKGISFTAKENEVVALLGRNGAGKSTTMRMLAGYLAPTSGDIRLCGESICDNPRTAKRLIGYLPEIPPLYLDMTVKAYLNFVYDLKKCKLPRRSHLKDVCTLCKIKDVENRLIKNLSKGYKQRVGLAQALINNPPVLILDEPTVGLDPKQIIDIRTLIKRLGKNHTVILSSHILSEIQAVCDRVIIINKGVVAADDTAANLSNKVTTDHRVIVRIDGPKAEVLQKIRELDNIKYVRADMEREAGIYEYEIEAEPGVDIRREINRIVRENGWNILLLRTMEMTLEDIFLKITMGETIINEKEANA